MSDREFCVNLGVDPPPDVLIEVEITRSALNRMAVYAALRVGQVWRFDGQTLHFHVLGPLMDRDEVTTVVRTTLLVCRLIARRTRTQADDLMVSILESNEDHLAEAIRMLAGRPATEEEALRALEQVGIGVR